MDISHLRFICIVSVEGAANESSEGNIIVKHFELTPSISSNFAYSANFTAFGASSLIIRDVIYYNFLVFLISLIIFNRSHWEWQYVYIRF